MKAQHDRDLEEVKEALKKVLPNSYLGHGVNQFSLDDFILFKNAILQAERSRKSEASVKGFEEHMEDHYSLMARDINPSQWDDALDVWKAAYSSRDGEVTKLEAEIVSINSCLIDAKKTFIELIKSGGKLEIENSELEEMVKELVEVLEFYSATESWDAIEAGESPYGTLIEGVIQEDDIEDYGKESVRFGGKRAREVLAKHKQKIEGMR